MKIKVKRKAKSRWAKDWVEIMSEAAEWCCAELGIEKDQARVDIRLKSKVDDISAGSAMTLRPFTRFVVIINECYCTDAYHILETLFHEFVHIRQELHQGLYLTEDYLEAHFEGMVYQYRDPAHFDAEYYNQPWEVEARKVGAELLEKYRKLLQF